MGVACPAGSYKSVPGFSACMKCVDTISTSAPGSSRCSCNVGYSGGNASQVDGAGCIPCGVGFAQDVTDSATCATWDMCLNPRVTVLPLATCAL